jgi:hypothetical protein
MFILADYLLFAGQALAGALYAVVLELVFKRRYEPGYTWVTVVWGTAQVGLLVALRLLVAPLPSFAHGGEAVWWSWWSWTLSFAASGVPVVFWQVVLQERRWKRLQDAWERWNVNE